MPSLIPTTQQISPPNVEEKKPLPEPIQQVPELPVTVIRPQTGWLSLNLGEIWRYRDLLYLLIWRDISARYRQSIVGYGWAIIKPLISVVIFTFVFGNVAGIKSDGIPYAMFSFASLLPWMYFATSLTNASGSVVGGSTLLSKVYFPRMILPLSSVAIGLIDLLVQLLPLPVLYYWFQVTPGPQIVFAPLFVLLAMITALAVGFWATALNVKYRDVGQIIPFLTQAWMFLSPIVYPSSAVPDKYRMLYSLNPMVGVIEGFRWSIVGTTPPDWSMMAVSLTVVAVLFITGIYYFRKTESTFADII